MRALRWSALRWSLQSGGHDQGSGGRPDHTGVGGLIGDKTTEIKSHIGVGLIGGLIGGLVGGVFLLLTSHGPHRSNAFKFEPFS